jgi:hypothetical protein
MSMQRSMHEMDVFTCGADELENVLLCELVAGSQQPLTVAVEAAGER